MKKTSDKQDRYVEGLELLAAIYAAAAEAHKEKRKAESTTNPAESKPTPRQKEVLINGSTS